MYRCATAKRPILFLLRWQRGNVRFFWSMICHHVTSLKALEHIFLWRAAQAGSSFVSMLKDVIILPHVASKFAGVSITKWAIEYEEHAGDALKFNHVESSMFIDYCSSILRWMISLTWKSLFLYLSICNRPVNWLWCRAVVEECGNADGCVSTSEATK